MNRRLIFSVMLFTVFACSLIVFTNPVLCTQIDEGNFSEGDVFLPCDGQYDFGTFYLNDTTVKNFTVKYVESGHVLLVDDTGNKVINIYNSDKMMNYKRIDVDSFIKEELQKTGWIVDGIEVHEIQFLIGDNMYSACMKDTSTDTFLYIATPSDEETADMVNSVEFHD